jgi:hypothetical protein
MSFVADIFDDCRPLLILRPWPFEVSSDSGKCLLVASHVRPGQDGYCLCFDCLEPRWFGWESCCRVVVSHKFG